MRRPQRSTDGYTAAQEYARTPERGKGFGNFRLFRTAQRSVAEPYPRALSTFFRNVMTINEFVLFGAYVSTK